MAETFGKKKQEVVRRLDRTEDLPIAECFAGAAVLHLDAVRIKAVGNRGRRSGQSPEEPPPRLRQLVRCTRRQIGGITAAVRARTKMRSTQPNREWGCSIRKVIAHTAGSASR